MFIDRRVLDFLNQLPTPDDILINEDGSRYIPYPFIVRDLNVVDPAWSDQNFSHFFFTMPDGRVKISGSIEIVVRLSDSVTRTLCGSATFYDEDYPDNEHWGATVKSLAIVNAAQRLGVRFGWGINDEFNKAKTVSDPSKLKGKPDPVLLQPDKIIIKQYNDALESGNEQKVKLLQSLYDLCNVKD